MTDLKGWLKNEDGQDLTEYALLAGFISIVAVIIIKSIGPLVNDLYQKVKDAFA